MAPVVTGPKRSSKKGESKFQSLGPNVPPVESSSSRSHATWKASVLSQFDKTPVNYYSYELPAVCHTELFPLFLLYPSFSPPDSWGTFSLRKFGYSNCATNKRRCSLPFVPHYCLRSVTVLSLPHVETLEIEYSCLLVSAELSVQADTLPKMPNTV